MRAQSALTQNELSDKIGVSTSAIGMYEQGRREPDHGTLMKLCRFFSVSTDYLLGVDENNFCDVECLLGEMKMRLGETRGLMFNGTPLSNEDAKKVMNAIMVAVTITLNEKDPDQA